MREKINKLNKRLIINLVLMAMMFFLTRPIAKTTFAAKIGNINVDVAGTVSETYDNNITIVNDDTKKDFITNLAVNIAAGYEGKNTAFELSADVAQHFFAHYSNFDSISVDLNGNLTQTLSKYDRITLKDIFIRAQEAASLADQFGNTTTGRYNYILNRFFLGYGHDFTSQFTTNFQYSNEVYQPSRSDLSDSFVNHFGIEGDYTVSPATILVFGYDYYERNFDPGGSASVNMITASLKEYLTKQAYLLFKAGYEFIGSYNGKDYNKPLFVASLVDDISPNTRWYITYKKEYDTNYYTNDIFNYWEAMAGLTRQVNKRTGLTLSGFYGEGKYPNIGLRDTLEGATIGLSYDIKENVKATLSYTFSKVDSNDRSHEYVRDVYNLGVAFKF